MLEASSHNLNTAYLGLSLPAFKSDLRLRIRSSSVNPKSVFEPRNDRTNVIARVPSNLFKRSSSAVTEASTRSRQRIANRANRFRKQANTDSGQKQDTAVLFAESGFDSLKVGFAEDFT